MTANRSLWRSEFCVNSREFTIQGKMQLSFQRSLLSHADYIFSVRKHILVYHRTESNFQPTGIPTLLKRLLNHCGRHILTEKKTVSAGWRFLTRRSDLF